MLWVLFCGPLKHIRRIAADLRPLSYCGADVFLLAIFLISKASYENVAKMVSNCWFILEYCTLLRVFLDSLSFPHWFLLSSGYLNWNITRLVFPSFSLGQNLVGLFLAAFNLSTCYHTLLLLLSWTEYVMASNLEDHRS